MIVGPRSAEVPEHFAHVRSDTFVVMPNHMHALLVLRERAANVRVQSDSIERFGAPVAGSVGTIVRSFKSATTRLMREKLHKPVIIWQPGFHDRRVHDAQEMQRARRYIAANPQRWTATHPQRDTVVRTVTYVTVPIATTHMQIPTATRFRGTDTQ